MGEKNGKKIGDVTASGRIDGKAIKVEKDRETENWAKAAAQKNKSNKQNGKKAKKSAKKKNEAIQPKASDEVNQRNRLYSVLAHPFNPANLIRNPAAIGAGDYSHIPYWNESEDCYGNQRWRPDYCNAEQVLRYIINFVNLWQGSRIKSEYSMVYAASAQIFSTSGVIYSGKDLFDLFELLSSLLIVIPSDSIANNLKVTCLSPTSFVAYGHVGNLYGEQPLPDYGDQLYASFSGNFESTTEDGSPNSIVIRYFNVGLTTFLVPAKKGKILANHK